MVKIKKEKVNRNDYVIMLPQGRRYSRFFAKTPKGCICVLTNSDILQNGLVSRYFTVDTPPGTIVGTITALYDPHVVVPQEITEEGFLRKDDPRYIPGVENTVYTDELNESIIYQYPFKGISSYSIQANQGTVISSSEKSLIFLARMLLKKIVVHMYSKANMFSLHASAIAKDNNAYLFLSGGHAGKSTIFMNLALNGYIPINDDILFIKKYEDKIFSESFALLPSVRESSTKYIYKWDNKEYESSQLGFQNEFYPDIWNHEKQFRAFPIKAIFIPNCGHSETEFIKAPTKTAQEKLIRSLITHSNFEVNDQTTEFINALFQIPIYVLHLSEDMEDFVGQFGQFITCL